MNQEIDNQLNLAICFSCKKQVQSSSLYSIVNKGENPLFQDMIKLNKSKLTKNNFQLCKECNTCLLTQQIPPYSVLNNMYLDDIPKELERLNFYERLLTQRAKCFLTIIKLQNQSGYKTNLLSAIKGLAVYLPLNIQDTQDYVFKTLPNTDLLKFIVEGLPTKNNTIWRGLVDLNKVIVALEWLKTNNPLYKDIIIDRSLLCNENESKVPLNNSYLVS